MKGAASHLGQLTPGMRLFRCRHREDRRTASPPRQLGSFMRRIGWRDGLLLSTISGNVFGLADLLRFIEYCQMSSSPTLVTMTTLLDDDKYNNSALPSRAKDRKYAITVVVHTYSARASARVR